MNNRAAALLLLIVFGVLFLQCAGGGEKPAPKEPVRTLADVDRDLQTFKTAIRSEISSKGNLFLVIGGASVALNFLLFGFVLYFWKQSRKLAASQKKKPVRKKAAAKKNGSQKRRTEERGIRWRCRSVNLLARGKSFFEPVIGHGLSGLIVIIRVLFFYLQKYDIYSVHLDYGGHSLMFFSSSLQKF